MASIELKCCICNTSFLPGVLNEDGKCPDCAKAFPNAKTLREAMASNQPEINLGDDVTIERVREIVREELNKDRADRRAEGLKKAREIKAEKKTVIGDK